MRQKVLQAGASAASLTLSNRSAFVLKVLENLLDPRYQDRNGDLVYNEACRDLQTACTLDLQRMAWKMPDKLMVGEGAKAAEGT